jgi:hypothetical protein
MTEVPTEKLEERLRKMSLKDKYPEIYAQTNIDRKGCKRVVPMEILSLGMGRTGTMCKLLYSSFLVVFLIGFRVRSLFSGGLIKVW